MQVLQSRKLDMSEEPQETIGSGEWYRMRWAEVRLGLSTTARGLLRKRETT